MLKVNEVEVVPMAADFNIESALVEYKAFPKPKVDFAKWLVSMGYVRVAPVAPVEKRKVKTNIQREL